MTRIEVDRVECECVVTFDGILDENGVRKSIRCSDVSIRVRRKE